MNLSSLQITSTNQSLNWNLQQWVAEVLCEEVLSSDLNPLPVTSIGWPRVVVLKKGEEGKNKPLTCHLALIQICVSEVTPSLGNLWKTWVTNTNILHKSLDKSPISCFRWRSLFPHGANECLEEGMWLFLQREAGFHPPTSSSKSVSIKFKASSSLVLLEGRIWFLTGICSFAFSIQESESNRKTGRHIMSLWRQGREKRIFALRRKK